MSSTESFLAAAGWAKIRREPLAGDASSRSYERLILGQKRGILMKDPRDDIGPFLAIARHLSNMGLSAPRILAAAPDQGLILMEDLGDDLIARLVDQNPDQEEPLYIAATDVLIALHSAPLPDGLKPYGPIEMALAIGPAAKFYAPAAEVPVTHKGWLHLTAAMEEALRATDFAPRVMIHRDYHAENLLWLPERKGAARIGLLDFQDALSGHPAYDLASLLADVRRDVPKAIRESAIRHYLGRTGFDQGIFRAALAAQSVQRNLRILGVFTRLCTHLGKPSYLALLPRVWSLLMADLSHPALAILHQAVLDTLPEPTPEKIDCIRRLAA